MSLKGSLLLVLCVLLLLVDSVLGRYNDYDPLHMHGMIVQKRRELGSKYGVHMVDIGDYNVASQWRVEQHSQYRLDTDTLDCEPFHQEHGMLFVYEHFDELFSFDDGDRVFQQIKAKQLPEGAFVGLSEVFMPHRHKWAYQVWNCEGKKMIVIGVRPIRPWKYSDFGLTAEGSPPAPEHWPPYDTSDDLRE